MITSRTWRGFTLIEVLVVVLIIGILTAVAVPQYRYVFWHSKVTQLLPLVEELKKGRILFLMNGGISRCLDVPAYADWAGLTYTNAVHAQGLYCDSRITMAGLTFQSVNGGIQIRCQDWTAKGFQLTMVLNPQTVQSLGVAYGTLYCSVTKNGGEKYCAAMTKHPPLTGCYGNAACYKLE